MDWVEVLVPQGGVGVEAVGSGPATAALRLAFNATTRPPPVLVHGHTEGLGQMPTLVVDLF